MNDDIRARDVSGHDRIVVEDARRSGKSISLSKVSLSFEGRIALENISLTLDAGERVGIIGANGSGKSTLCRAITGHVRPQGSIFFDGKKSAKRASQHAKMGVRSSLCFPQYIEDLSIEENVMLGLPPSKGDGVLPAIFFPRIFYREKERTARAILEYCHIDPDHVGEMTFDVRRNIELARMLMGNPRILVFDEPTTGLTLEQSGRYCDVIGDYVETFSTTLIMASNDMSVIRTMCQRVIALDAGRVIADGDVASVLTNADVKKRIMETGIVA